MFAEGSTSNGKGLMDFKKGCFIMDTPLIVKGLKYSGRVSYGYTLMSGLDYFLTTASNLTGEVVIHSIDKKIVK